MDIDKGKFRKKLEEAAELPIEEFIDEVCGVQHKINLFGDYDGANVHAYNLVGKDYHAVKVILDTESAYIKAKWGEEIVEVPYSYEKAEQIQTYWEDQYNGLH